MAADITSLVISVTSQGIKEASTALSGLGTSAANAEKRINSLIEATKRLNTINETAAKSFVNVADKMREQDKLLSNMAANSRTSARGVQDLAAAMLLLSTSLNLMNQNIVRTTVSTRAHNESMREAHALARGLSGSLGALWLTYGNLAGMSVGVAIGAGLKGIISVGKDVENTLEGIRVRAGESRESMIQVAEAVERIGKGVYGPQEVAKAFETLALAGLKAKESTLAIGAALNLATAGGTSIEKAAESLVTIGTAVGATAKSFDMLADGITAAANSSLASVDSIAESVKRASVVNKLYGASFDDILTQTAALAQLGIKNTAAGTAIVNFYSNSLGQTEKSKKALDALGMSFTDLNGKAKPVVDAFEEFTEKLNKFDLKSQQTIINDIFGERALRDVEGLRDAVNRSADDTATYSNKLREIQGQIAEAAGTAALQSVQLGLTTSKQMESVGNTLKTSLSAAFTEVAPTIKEVSDRLKEVLGSPEFVRSIANIATGIANLTAFLVENYKAVGYVVEGFLLWKGITLGANMFEAMARGLTGVASAMGFVTVATNGAAVGTGALATALRFLPGIGLVLTGLTAAWALYNLHSGKAKDVAQQTADTYNKDFLKALKEEAERLEKTNEVIASGTSIKEADAVATRELAMAKLQETNADAVASAQKTRDEAAAALKAKKIINYAYDDKSSKEAKALTAAQDTLNKATETYSQTMSDAVMLTNRVVEASKIKKAAYAAEALAAEQAAKAAAGNLKFGGAKPDKAAVNDAYAAAITSLNNKIKAAKKDMQNFDDKLNDQFKAGEMGKLQVIQSSAENQIAEYEKIGKTIQDQIDKASKGKNKTADVEKFSGLQEANTEAIEQAKRKQAQETSVYISQLRQDSNREAVKQLEEEGNYVSAAALRWSTEYSPAIQAVQKDYEALGDKFPEIGERLKQLEATQESFMDAARVKELSKEYNVLALEIANTLKGVQTASEDQGLVAMWTAAQDATEKYKASLPGLAAQLEKLKRFAMADDASTGDKKAYEEALSQQTSLAEKYKTMWTGVGKSISDSLGDAFGKSGKAAGDILQSIVKYNNTDNKSIEAKNKLYGSMAGAAKNFFKEGSTGYKVMAAAEKVFRAIELANMIKSLFVHEAITTAKVTGTAIGQVAETSEVIAGEAARNTAKVPGVFMSFMSALGPWGAAAAAVAIAAVLGGAFSGGGGGGMSAAERQAKQGTGSVLGDDSAKSESIAKSLELIQRDSGLGLVHFKSMDTSLKAVVAGLGSLGASIVQFGGVNDVSKQIAEGQSSGFFSKLATSIFGGKTTVQDSGISFGAGTVGSIGTSGVNAQSYNDIKKSGGWFSSDKYRTETKDLGSDISGKFSDIISNMAKTITAAADMIGIGGSAFNEHLKSFVVDLGKISLKDLKGDEVTDALNAIFSKLGDDMAMFAVDGLKNFQKIGEGYLETLSRVANELIQVQDVFAVLGKSMTSTGLAAIQSSQNFIDLFGSIDKLTEATSYFVENFLTDADKLKPIQESLTKEMNRLGLSSIDTVEEFKNLVLAQDLNTKAGQEMYANLMNVAPAFLAVSEASTKAAEAIADLANKRLDMLLTIAELEGNSAAATSIIAQQRSIELAAMDASLRPLQERINFLNDEKAATEKSNSLRDKTLSLSLTLANLEGNTAAATAIVAQQRLIELAAMDASLRPIQERINLLTDEKAAATAAADAIKKNIDALKTTAQNDFNVLSKALTKAKNDAQVAYDAQAAIINAQISSLETVRNGITELSNALDSTLDSMLDNAALAMTRAQAQAKLDEALKTARTTGKLPSAADLKDTLATLAKDPADSFSSYADYIKDVGITAGKVSNLADIAKGQETAVDKQIALAQKQLDVAKDTLDKEMAKYDMLLAFEQQQLDAMNGTTVAVQNLTAALVNFNSSVLAATAAQAGQTGSNGKPITSVRATEDDIKNLYKNVLGREGDAGGLEYYKKLASEGYTASQLSQFFMQSPEYLAKHPDGSHAGGLDYVPKDNYIARLHKGEKVLTAQEAKKSRDGGSEDMIATAVSAACSATLEMLDPLVKDVSYMKKLLQNSSPDGNSIQVTIVS